MACRIRSSVLPVALVALFASVHAACAQEPVPAALGPIDGLDLPATDLERVGVGDLAPDFTLETISGDTLTLSSFRGQKNVVLVFYRGHW